MEIKIEDWCKDNHLKVESFLEGFLKLEGIESAFFVLFFRDELFREVIDKNLILNLTDKEFDIAESYEDTKKFNFLFQFGESFYYCPWKQIKVIEMDNFYAAELNDFLYLGKADLNRKQYPILGLHSEYEMLNSALNIKSAIKKSKFFGIKSIGICDKNTLGGTLSFQLECKKNGIKPVIGETISVSYESGGFEVYHELKLYCTDEKSWFNLMGINQIINTEYKGVHIPEARLLELGEGLICVFDYSNSILKDITDKKKYEKIITLYRERFHSIYYQFSSVEYSLDTFDSGCLSGFKFYLNNFYSQDFPFVIIEDTYYLEKNQSICKVDVNAISGKATQHSYNQHFKQVEEIFETISPLFEGTKAIQLGDFFELGMKMVDKICEHCPFEIPMEGAKLPKYEEEGVEFTNEQSIIKLREICEKGFDDKIRSNPELDEEVYRERLEREFDVISKSGFADYFLIIWDTCNFAVENDVMIGMGRGSVGGSLIAMIIGLTRTDPIKYDLLFERFLNEARITPDLFAIAKLNDKSERRWKIDEYVETKRGRILSQELVDGDSIKINEKDFLQIEDVDYKEVKRGDSMPDVDTDFPGTQKDNIKDYLKVKYGEKHTCSVGTYGRLKLKQTFKDLSKIEGISFQDSNLMTSLMDHEIDYTFDDLFKYCLNQPELKQFVQAHSNMIMRLKTIMNNPKSLSVHPSAVLVLPKYDLEGRERDLSNWIPTRDVDGVLVSEWEGKYCDAFGLLKNDILGLAQLDKFVDTLELIKNTTGDIIDLDNIPLDDKKVFEFFGHGFTEDVFQFSGRGIKGYCKKVKPNELNHLIAMCSLYRPGPMKSNAHKNYALIKHGKKEAEYDWGMKEITESTYGLFIYQEQIMQAFVRAGFSLVEADGIRTAMKKFDAKGMAKLKDEFIKKLSSQMKGGNSEKICEKIWDKLLAFGAYGFNKSHSSAYSLISYQSQWLKTNYPLQFWTIALNYGDEVDNIPFFLSEIKNISFIIKDCKEVNVQTADINISTEKFECVVKDNSILWSLKKIKGLGESASSKILIHRKRVGRFESLEHFLKEVPKKDVNKKHVTCLILAGAFDRIEGVESPAMRQVVLDDFYAMMKHDKDKCKYLTDPMSSEDNTWKRWELEITGAGYIDYESFLYNDKTVPPKVKSLYLGEYTFLNIPSPPEYIRELGFAKNAFPNPENYVARFFESVGKRVGLAGKVIDISPAIVDHYRTKSDSIETYRKVNLKINYVNVEIIIRNRLIKKFEQAFIDSVGSVIYITGKSMRRNDRDHTLHLDEDSLFFKLK